MATVDLAIANGLIVTPEGRQRATILVEAGRIAGIVDTPPEAQQVIDASGLVVFPGFIDGHVHFRDPAFPDKEDFTSGTRANAKAGVTTVLEMPMADVGTSTAERFRERRESLAPKAVVDWGMWAGGGADAAPHIQAMAKEGAVGFKTFAREIYPARAANFEGTVASDDPGLLRVAKAIAATGRTWSVHAENYGIVKELALEVDDAGLWHGQDAFTAIRPPLIEVEPISKLLLIAKEVGAHLHIAHITTRSGLELIRQARERGQRATAEACLPHLIFTEQDISRLGPLGYFTPRLRTESDRTALWEGISGGWVQMVASDHSPWTARDLAEGWNGQPAAKKYMATTGSASAEFLTTFILDWAVRNGVPLEAVARVMSEGPARLTGLWPKKGSLHVGSDADITIVDLGRSELIAGARMESKAKVTPFEGVTVKGVPVYTIVRGRVVMSERTVVGEPGWGAFQRPVDAPSS